MAGDCHFAFTLPEPPVVRVAEPGWVRLTSKYTKLPVMIRRDGQLALTPAEHPPDGTTIYAAGKVIAVLEPFDTVCSYFGVDLP